LKAQGLQVIIHARGTAGVLTSGVLASIAVVGHDRPGILRSVSAVLAQHGLNVEDLASERVSAPMGGGTLFQARATVSVPPGTNLSAVRTDLEKLASDLMVDLTLQPRMV
jgi:glycine cleavage system regulatory protein